MCFDGVILGGRDSGQAISSPCHEFLPTRLLGHLLDLMKGCRGCLPCLLREMEFPQLAQDATDEPAMSELAGQSEAHR